MQISDVLHDALHCIHRNLISACFSMLFSVPGGMSLLGCGDRDATFLRRVLELLVAADLIDFIPPIFFQFPYNVPTVHPPLSPTIPQATHGIHTVYRSMTTPRV